MQCLCIAVIADVIRSRRIEEPQRPQIQERLEAFLAAINERYAAFVLARFVITTGDEFQGLLSASIPIPDLLWDMEQELPIKVRLGIGLGPLSTRLQLNAIGMDGPAWHRARDAIKEAKKRQKLGGVFGGFGDSDEVLNGLARLLHHFRDSLVPSQQLTLARLRSLRHHQSTLVGDLAPTKQAVHERVKSARWAVYREGEAAFRAALRPYDYSEAWRAR